MKTPLVLLLILPITLWAQKTTVKKTTDTLTSKTQSAPNLSGMYIISNGKYSKVEELNCYNFNMIDSMKFILELKNEYEVYDRLEIHSYIKRASKKNESGYDKDFDYFLRGELNKFDFTQGKWATRKYTIVNFTNPTKTPLSSTLLTQADADQWLYKSNKDTLANDYQICVFLHKMKISGYQEYYNSNTNSFERVPMYSTSEIEPLLTLQLNNQPVIKMTVAHSADEKNQIITKLQGMGYYTYDMIYITPPELKDGEKSKRKQQAREEFRIQYWSSKLDFYKTNCSNTYQSFTTEKEIIAAQRK